MFQQSVTANDIWFMLSGAGTALLLTFWAVLGGTVLGIVFGVVRASGPKWLSLLIGALLDVFRSVPLLIQLVLFNSVNSVFRAGIEPFTVACVALAVYTAALCTEVVRSGVLAVPFTTRRAARSLGMTAFQDLLYIVLPMATRVALPSWIGICLGVMKDTSLVLWIGIIELLRSSQIVITRTQEPLTVLMIAGAIYFLMSFPIARIGARLERRWASQ